MKRDGLAKWLTLGANFGVLIGLVLLIVELSQNRNMMRAQIRHDLAMGIVDILQTSANNAQLADVLYRGGAGEPLDRVETWQMRMRTNALFRYWEDVHYQYRNGLYDETEFSRQREAWSASFARSQWQAGYWCEVRLHYSPEFTAQIDALLQDTPC